MKLRVLTRSAIFLALLIISSYISFPISEISFTLQVLVVLLISLLLPFKESFLIILLYFIMGLLGFPVFSQGGGFAYLMKPSFGYLLGFLFSPICVALVNKIKIKNRFVLDSFASILSLILIYLFGTIYFFFIMNVVNGVNYSLSKIIGICIIPFIPIDLMKIVAAVIIMVSLRKIIKIKVVEENEKKVVNKRRHLIKR